MEPFGLVLSPDMPSIFHVIFSEKRPKLSLEHQTDDWDWKWDDGCQTEIVVNVSKNIEADDDDNEYDKYYTAGDADGDQNPPQMAAPHGDDDDSDVDSISDELVFSWEELPPVISANPRTAVFQPGINRLSQNLLVR